MTVHGASAFRRLGLAASGTLLVVLIAAAPALAAKYNFSITNATGKELKVQFTRIECMRSVPAPFTMPANLKWSVNLVETDESGKCAVLHRPSKFGLVFEVPGVGSHTITWEKWAVSGWGWHQSGHNTVGVHVTIHNSGIDISVH